MNLCLFRRCRPIFLKSRTSIEIFDIQRYLVTCKPRSYYYSSPQERLINRAPWYILPSSIGRCRETPKRHLCVRLLFPHQTSVLSHYDDSCSIFRSNSISKSVTTVNLRFFSKDYNETNESKEVSIQNDIWLKTLLNDIKQDFATTSNENSSAEENSSSETSSTLSNRCDLSPERNEEYDYRYADENDEIEEFGFYDDHEIGQEKTSEKVLPISLDRSKNGVFELEELTILLEHLGAANIVSVPVPAEANYCDHMVIVTAKSKRHLKALNEEMLWVHKRKKSKKDPLLHIEGFNKSDWCAMDLGNLVLHIFLNEETRLYYDIESLWLLGPENDPKCREEDEHSFALSSEDLFWLEATGSTKPKTDEKSDV